MTQKEFLDKLKEETVEYMDSIIPRNIDGMPVRRGCEISMFFEFPTIELYVSSVEYGKHESLFGMKYREEFKFMQFNDFDMRIAHDYYQVRLQNKVDQMFREYCKQICRHEKMEEES